MDSKDDGFGMAFLWEKIKYSRLAEKEVTGRTK